MQTAWKKVLHVTLGCTVGNGILGIENRWTFYTKRFLLLSTKGTQSYIKALYYGHNREKKKLDYHKHEGT